MSPTILPGSKTKAPGVRERNVVYWQFFVGVFLVVSADSARHSVRCS